MRKTIAAAALAACLAVPAHPQTAPAPPVQAAQSEAPIPVPDDAPAGSSGPSAVSSGVSAGLLVVVLGIVLLSSMAFMGEA